MIIETFATNVSIYPTIYLPIAAYTMKFIEYCRKHTDKVEIVDVCACVCHRARQQAIIF